MQIVFNVPVNLQGQNVSQLLDCGLADGSARGAGPTGPLGTTITLSFAYVKQATDLGFTPTSYIYG